MRLLVLAGVAQLVGASSCKPKGHGDNSQSGHIPGLQVRYPVGAFARGNLLMFLSHIDVSLPPFPSLKSISMSLGEDEKTKVLNVGQNNNILKEQTKINKGKIAIHRWKNNCCWNE